MLMSLRRALRRTTYDMANEKITHRVEASNLFGAAVHGFKQLFLPRFDQAVMRSKAVFDQLWKQLQHMGIYIFYPRDFCMFP